MLYLQINQKKHCLSIKEKFVVNVTTKNLYDQNTMCYLSETYAANTK